MNRSSLGIKIIIGIVGCLVVGFLSGFATSDAISGWYVDIVKPSFNPPNWIFGPVWTILYTLMGISAALVWHQGWEKREVKIALSFFAIQLLLNGLWSIIFFGAQQLGLAFAEIILLWIMIVVCIILFSNINKTASYLLIPYLLWVSFATILNFNIWQLN